MNLATYLDRQPARPFQPPACLRNGAVQTVLSTVRSDVPEVLNHSGQPLLIEAGWDETGRDQGSVRLLAYYDPPRGTDRPKGAAILLHGWEGCSHSTYDIVTTRELTAAGYHVVRLNLRDHGPGLHIHPESLNSGVFLGTLLMESVQAIAQSAAMFDPLPVYLVGFSMGGNFALRAAIHYGAGEIPNLRRVIAANPSINPSWSTLRLDRNSALRWYFRNLWLNQLRQKQRFFPDLYDFEPLSHISSLVEMTTWLVRYLGVYEDAEEYFASYAVLGSATENLQVPTYVMTTLDDPIIPVADFYGLAPSPYLALDIHTHGGHVGYLDGLPIKHTVGGMVRDAMECEWEDSSLSPTRSLQ